MSSQLAFFDAIIPCGIREHGVTSMARLLGRSPEMEEVGSRVADAFSAVFERELRAGQQPRAPGQ